LRGNWIWELGGHIYGKKLCCAANSKRMTNTPLCCVFFWAHGKGPSLSCVAAKPHVKGFFNKIQILNRKTSKLSNNLKKTKIAHKTTYVVYCLWKKF
jgi:hypothetical protein